nr:10381_t:CDS:2 [Entrophospora candida]
MDEIFTKLAIHTASLKQVTNYIVNSDSSSSSTQNNLDIEELERVKENLELSIQMVQPAIDLIEIISARGNTSLEQTVNYTTRLRKEIESFAQKISSALADNDDVNIIQKLLSKKCKA